MAPTEASKRGRTTTLAIRGRAPAGVRKNMPVPKATSRHSQQYLDHSTHGTKNTNSPSGNSEGSEPITPQYSQSSPNNYRIHILHALSSNTISLEPATLISLREVDSHTLSRSPSNITMNLSSMHQHLRSDELDIGDWVVLQLTSNNRNPQSPTHQHAQQLTIPTQGTQPQATQLYTK